MKLGMIGLGKMGGNMSRRLAKAGHSVVGYNLEPAPTKELEAEVNGFSGAYSLEEIVEKTSGGDRRVIWVMVPAGKPTEMTVDALAELCDAGDIIIDGGNSNYKETQRRAEMLKEKGIEMVDCGTSGGVWGLKEGYSMMIGGNETAVSHLTPIFEALAPGKELGWGHVGPNGSGHYTKMIHNGIEYGMMQAYAEGFDILRHKEEFGLDLHQVAQIWRHGSVVRSWLLDLTANALSEDQDFADIAPYVTDSGEGRWTVFDAIDLDVPAPVITLALQMRLISRDQEAYWARMLSAMRNQFGGHAVKKDEE